MSSRRHLHTIPSEDVEIEHCRGCHLRSLDLRGQHLAVIPSALFKHGNLLTHLAALDLSFNSLRELSPCIRQLVNLTQLRVHHNNLRRLPTELACLKNLETLDVSHNAITAFPTCLSKLFALQVVNFSGNRLKCLDEEVFRLPKLRIFAVTRNRITNVPRDVYVYGLLAIRRHFGINIERDGDFPSRMVSSELTLKDQLRTLCLRPISNSASHTQYDLKTLDEDDHEVTFINDGRRPVRDRHKRVSDLALDRKMSTSDYGSCSGSNVESDRLRLELDVDSPHSCYGDCGSDNGDLTLDTSEEEERCDICSGPLNREVDLGDRTSCNFILPNRARLLKVSNVTVVIPENNVMNYMRNEFTLELVEDHSFLPDSEGGMVVQASSVVLLEPHGAVFYKDSPALIRLPIFIKVPFPSQIHCLRSNTGALERPAWERIPSSDFRVRDGYVILRTNHFSLFTAVLNKMPFTVHRTISPEEGGTIEVNEVPGLHVQFPQGCVNENIQASVRVLCSELRAENRTNMDPSDALATPAVILQPHGYLFNSLPGNPVVVRLPLPDYSAIIQSFGFEAQLSVWHSPTTEDEPVAWKVLNTDFQIVCDENENYFIDIQVNHFSWLTGLWASIKEKIQKARLGVGYAYTGGPVSMKCQAWMLDNRDTGKFGLVVICHNSENPLQEVGNYAKNVGGSFKPVSIGPGGSIIVKLGKSDYFEADTAIGEDESLEKIEENYRGGEFEKQFACKFKGTPSDKDIFGKVFVRRRWDNGSEERLFEFNLIKKTDEPATPSEDSWAVASLKEIAEMYSITDGDNWKMFARELGFSLQDLRIKFGRSSDVFAAIVAEYRRQGGTHGDFMLSLHKVGRKLRLDIGGEEEPSQQQAQTPGWAEMLSFGFLRGGGQTLPSSTPSMGSGDYDQQPGTTTTPSRKRVCPTCIAQTPTRPHPPSKRQRRYPSSASPAGGSSTSEEEETSLESLQIGSGRLRSPPRSSPRSPFMPPFMPPLMAPLSEPMPMHSSLPTALPTFSRYSPPLGTMTRQQSQQMSVVQSHTGNLMSSGQSTHSPGMAYNNTPFTETRYGAIPSTSNQTMPTGQLRVDEHLMRQNTEEIPQMHLYRIAPLIQPYWVNVARYVRNDDSLEADIKLLQEHYKDNELEQATQVLLQWREKCPDTCNKGRLYSALCDLQLKVVAKKCQQVYLI